MQNYRKVICIIFFIFHTQTTQQVEIIQTKLRISDIFFYLSYSPTIVRYFLLLCKEDTTRKRPDCITICYHLSHNISVFKIEKYSILLTCWPVSKKKNQSHMSDLSDQ